MGQHMGVRWPARQQTPARRSRSGDWQQQVAAIEVQLREQLAPARDAEMVADICACWGQSA